MKLLRMKLENWRGVESREVQFADGVTLIEGPNEIGKSTIVEALQSLFAVMDSSKGSNIKAIQPVGQDVGSGVEVELMAGDFHFIYSKTYNKNRKTELRVLSPRAEQLTGREAHERVEAILRESVDMALWNALLVEQGNEVAGVTLSQSNGLARALDEAAGGDSPEQGDGDLFARVQAEYEEYFNLKSGKAKRNYTDLEKSVLSATEDVSKARDLLKDIETDSDNYERCSAEILRLQSELPDLQQGEIDHEKKWRAISEVQNEIAGKQVNLQTAEDLWRSEDERLTGRNRLIEQVEESAQNLELEHSKLEPLNKQINELKALEASEREALEKAKADKREYGKITDIAKADVDHLEKAGQLELLKENLAKHQKHSLELESNRAAQRAIKITAVGLEELRDADRELHVATARLDTATSSIEINAESELKLALNDEELAMSAGQIEQRNIADELAIIIPGVASIRIKPPQSAKELEKTAGDLREDLSSLLRRFDIQNLSEAVTKDQERAQYEGKVQSLKDKIEGLLNGASLTEWQALVADLELESESYLAQRAAEPAIPSSLHEAKSAAKEIKSILETCSQTVENLEDSYAELVENYNNANASLQTGNDVVIGLEAAKQQREEDLKKARAAESDEALLTLVATRTANLEAVQGEIEELEERLKSDSPETAEALYLNAKAAHQRAIEENAAQLTQQAILEDRLEQAQANGRFEELEAAEHKLVALEESYNATHARAMAAQRLWQTLNTHRDASRKSYVRPLKEGVEQLGKIVFGSDFTIELGEDWDLLSRTQDGKTIPFDDLSIGAKEQLGILMRLAAARIVSKQGGVPLIIDDALGFSDPTRLKTMGAAIASAGRDCQVILLTCTPGRFTHVGNAEVVRF